MKIRKQHVLGAAAAVLTVFGIELAEKWRDVDATKRVPSRLLAERGNRGELRGPKPFDEPYEAERFYLRKRLPPGESQLPIERYFEAREKMKSMPRYSSALGRVLSRDEIAAADARGPAGPGAEALGTWQPLGPGNIGGRTRAFLVHPANASIMYAAGVDGGVWKSTDGGASWAPKGDLLPNIAVSVLAFSPANPSILYAGTGEGYFSIDAVRGAGIFKSTNAGGAWTRLSSTNNSNFWYVNDIVVSPNSASRIYAATSNGVWRSLDAGATWSHPLTATDCLDLEVRTDLNPDVVFVACGNFSPGRIYRSTNSGSSFSSVFSRSDMGRVSLAIAPSTQSVVYALATDISDGNGDGFADDYSLLDVFRSTTGGGSGSWSARVNHGTKLNNQLLSNTVYAHLSDCGFGFDQRFGQGWYDNEIAVDPVNSNIVYAGGIDTFRSDDGGANWGMMSHWWASPGNSHLVHADQHRFFFHPGYNGTTNRTLFVGNDGGLFRTTNARAATAKGNTAPCNPDANGSVAWSDLNNGYAVTQFYHGAPYPNGASYFGGTQDNGTVRGTNVAGSNAWAEILGGDGGYVAVHPTTTTRLYAENTGLSIQRSTDGGANWANTITGISDPGFPFIATFIMDPNNPGTLWAGGWYLWRTTNGASSWVRGSALTPGNGSVSALAVAKGNSNKAVFGMDDGYIGRNSSALSAGSTTSWSSVRPRTGYVGGLAFDPSNSNIVYAAYSTFGGGGHVWKSTNGGALFTNISGSGGTGLPDIPAHSIVVDPANPARVYVGTDLGVFVTTDGGATWFVENTGFANVVVESLSLIKPGGTNTLFAFTHGRGAWKVGLVP